MKLYFLSTKVPEQGSGIYIMYKLDSNKMNRNFAMSNSDCYHTRK